MRVLVPLLALILVAAGVGSWAAVRGSGSGAGHGRVTPAPAQLPVLTSAGAIDSAGDLGDPAILTVPAGPSGPAHYVLFGTGDWESNVPTATSTDLKTWTPGPDAMPSVPAWSRSDTYHSHIWAPAAARIGGRWLLYVTVPDPVSGRQCLAVTASDRPEGPYRDALGAPLVCQRALGGSIDPSVSVTSGGPVLLWKSDGNCCGLPATIWSQRLRGDGLAVTGTPHALLRDAQPWQQGVVEEPSAVPASAGGWWLFYSGNAFDKPDYSIGVASCRTLDGPCTDLSKTPYRTSVPGQRSPGGLDMFRDVDGQIKVVFDTWTRPPDASGVYRCCRAIDIAELDQL